MYTDVSVFIAACEQQKCEANASLYRNLIAEEFNEFIQANNKNDEVEKLDACMDMIWVILGFCIMKDYDVQGAWDEVARSNLSKIDKATGKVIKRADGKVLKPEGWKPPELAKYVRKRHDKRN
jgi:predicted HAD superfamily Cof-like phosphohydrolase